MGDYAGAWLRVSGTGQDEANQEPDVMGWIAARGYELARTYRLHGKSASKGQHQQALGEMLADMRAGLVTVLVVWAADRIERRGALSALTLAEQVREAGGRIEYVKDAHLNAVNEMSDVMLALSATVAREESRRRKERVAMTRDRIRAEGGFIGRPGWGLEITGPKYAKTIVPTEDGRRLVPEMFARCIAGESEASIGRWLETETGRPWWPRTVGKMLRNPAYRGAVTDAAGRVVQRCEPLVSAAVFRRAGEALAGRPKRGPSDPGNRAMLASALYCPRCADSPMYRITGGYGASRGQYYRCAGRGANRKGCGNMVRLALVDTAVNAIIARWFDTPVMRHQVIAGNKDELEARAEEIRLQIAQLGALDLPDEEYDARLAELRAQRDEVKNTEIVPDRVELTATRDRYSRLWQRVPVPQRGPWLARHGFRVTADKTEVTVRQGTTEVTLPL